MVRPKECSQLVLHVSAACRAGSDYIRKSTIPRFAFVKWLVLFTVVEFGLIYMVEILIVLSPDNDMSQEAAWFTVLNDCNPSRRIH